MNYVRRYFFLIPIFLIISSTGTAAVAQSAMPDTPAANRLAAWLRVLAGGKQIEFKRFIGEHYSEALLKEDTAHDRADRQARLYLDTRGLNVRNVESSTPREIVVLAQATLTHLWFRVTLKLDEANIKIAAYTTGRIPMPPGREERLTERELVREVGAFMKKLTDVDAFSGVLLIAKDGRPIFKRAYGLASKAYNVPNRTDTKLNIASAAKMFTAVAIMQLVEQGKLSVTDTIAKILPDYPNKQVAEKVTIHHLLSHSSGLGDYHGAEYICRKGILRSVRDYYPLLAKLNLLFEPGEKMQYSNAGYVVLGVIIEKASGESYFDYVDRYIFKPSGMTDTGFYEADVDTPNIATGYTNFVDKGDDYFEFHMGERRNTSLINGARGSSQGGAASTVMDLLRFRLALTGNKLLSAKSVELLTTKKYFFRKYAAGDIYYGYGFELEIGEGKRVIGHGGGDLGISSGVRWYPDNGYTLAILSNYDRGGIVAIDKLQEMIINSRR
jgi:CubicO group peptidase (beta-lactamase class C family)